MHHRQRNNYVVNRGTSVFCLYIFFKLNRVGIKIWMFLWTTLLKHIQAMTACYKNRKEGGDTWFWSSELKCHFSVYLPENETVHSSPSQSFVQEAQHAEKQLSGMSEHPKMRETSSFLWEHMLSEWLCRYTRSLKVIWKLHWMKSCSYQPCLDQSQTLRCHQQQKMDWEPISETDMFEELCSQPNFGP